MRKILFLGLLAPAFLVGAAHPDRAGGDRADHREHRAAQHGHHAHSADRHGHPGHATDQRHPARVAAAEAPQATYRPCQPGPGDDRCIQLYERGVRSAYAGWQQRRGVEMRTSRHRDAVRVAMRTPARASHRVRRAGERG